MTDWTDTEMVALRKMIAKAEADPTFTKEDVAALKHMADAFRGFQYFGRFAKWVIFLLAALAGAISAWEAVAEKVQSWFGA